MINSTDPTYGHETNVAIAMMPSWTIEERYRFFLFSAYYQGIGCVTIGLVSVALWEHVLLLPAEIQTWKLLLVGKFQCARVAVLVGRYSLLALIGCISSITLGRPASCKGAMGSVIALYLVSWTSCATIYLTRLSIIWSNNSNVIVACTVLMLFCLVVWIVIALTAYEMDELPPQWQFPYGLKCYIHLRTRIAASGWLLSCLFDFVVLVLTWYRLQRIKDKGGLAVRAHRCLWQSSVSHFGFSLVVHLACFISQLSITNPILAHIPNTIGFGCRTIIASRLTLSSRGWVIDYDEGESIEWQCAADVGAALEKPRSMLRQRIARPEAMPNITFEHSIEEQYEYRLPVAEHSLTPEEDEPGRLTSERFSTNSNRTLGGRLSVHSTRAPSMVVRGAEHEQRMACLDEYALPRRSSATGRRSQHVETKDSPDSTGDESALDLPKRATHHADIPEMEEVASRHAVIRGRSASWTVDPSRIEDVRDHAAHHRSSTTQMRPTQAYDDGDEGEYIDDGDERPVLTRRKSGKSTKHRPQSAVVSEVLRFSSAPDLAYRSSLSGRLEGYESGGYEKHGDY
ncbi:unnamed protein product [Parajaminaea phylloscopi]